MVPRNTVRFRATQGERKVFIPTRHKSVLEGTYRNGEGAGGSNACCVNPGLTYDLGRREQNKGDEHYYGGP